MDIVIKSSVMFHKDIEFILSRMSECRMPYIMRKRERFRQCFIQSQSSCYCARNVTDFNGMRKPGPVVIAFMIQENLCLILETAKGCRVDNAVTVSLKIRTEFGRGFRIFSAAGQTAFHRVRRQTALFNFFENVFDKSGHHAGTSVPLLR